MSNIGKIIRVNALPPAGERELNVIYQVAAPGAATYTDYAIDANGDLKTHAVVDGYVSISDFNLIGEGITTQANFNVNTRDKLNNKLDKPYFDGNIQEYNKIIALNAYGDTAKLSVEDLGKNIANSSLTSVQGAALTLGADWAVYTSGFNYSIAGLPDVSGDGSFTKNIVARPDGTIGWEDTSNSVIDKNIVSLNTTSYPNIYAYKNMLSKKSSFIALYLDLSIGSLSSNSAYMLGIIPSEYRPKDNTLIMGQIRYIENSQWVSKLTSFFLEASNGQISLMDSLPASTNVTVFISTQYVKL
ncbi:hypothetical protein [Chryseobacterium sp. G0201]|uniref:hypothetical protein n=1 Tax=Chryseobacterium sp. G0201 TaxID=2487065 RepID=UPI000F4D3984|nr:hypothetical protein [Chryseobacterium sp. G0201]AZA52917.1 hypothetical protein EG348_07790 [Chryseobacterium sp. G0201]